MREERGVQGASASRPGSREPSPAGSAASGFDPSRNAFVENLRQFNRRWGIAGEPSFEQVAHMLAVFGLEFIPSSRPLRVKHERGATLTAGTLKSAAVEGLRDGPCLVHELLLRVERIRGKHVDRTSLSPQLSRLKEEGIVCLNDGVWALCDSDGPRMAETEGLGAEPDQRGPSTTASPNDSPHQTPPKGDE